MMTSTSINEKKNTLRREQHKNSQVTDEPSDTSRDTCRSFSFEEEEEEEEDCRFSDEISRANNRYVLRLRHRAQPENKKTFRARTSGPDYRFPSPLRLQLRGDN